MNIIQYDKPQPWMLEAIMPHLAEGTNHQIIRRMCLRTEVRERRWLGDEEAEWWCPIVIDTEMEAFEKAVATADSALVQLPTLPVVGVPESYELTYAYLYDWFMHHPEGDVPWGQFGYEYVEEGWSTLVVPNPIPVLVDREPPKGAKYAAGSFEQWLRITRKDLVTQVYGARSTTIRYEVVTCTGKIAEAILHMLPSFVQKWTEYYRDHRALAESNLHSEVLAQADEARRFFTSDLHCEDAHRAGIWLYFYEELSYAIQAERGFAIIGYDGDEPVIMVTARGTPGMAASPRVEYHTELVMRSTDEKYKRYALVPTVHAHAIRHAFWDRRAAYLDLHSNWDPDIDGYKLRFGAVERPLPGLRYKK